MNKYLTKRFSGNYAQSIANGIENCIFSTNELTSYLNDLSIDIASEKELESIGLLIGWARPYVPFEVAIPNALIFFDANKPPIFSENHGLSDVNDLEIGGRFTSTEIDIYKLDLSIYRLFLKQIAIIKRFGLSLKTLDDLLIISNSTYTISYNEYHDIIVTIADTTDFVYVYLFQVLFQLLSFHPRLLLLVE